MSSRSPGPSPSCSSSPLDDPLTGLISCAQAWRQSSPHTCSLGPIALWRASWKRMPRGTEHLAPLCRMRGRGPTGTFIRLVGDASCTDGSGGRKAACPTRSSTSPGVLRVAWWMRRFLRPTHAGGVSRTCGVEVIARAEKQLDFMSFTRLSTAPLDSGPALSQARRPTCRSVGKSPSTCASTAPPHPSLATNTPSWSMTGSSARPPILQGNRYVAVQVSAESSLWSWAWTSRQRERRSRGHRRRTVGPPSRFSSGAAPEPLGEWMKLRGACSSPGSESNSPLSACLSTGAS